MYIPALALTLALALPGVAAFADQAPAPPQTTAVQQHDHQAGPQKACCGAAKKDGEKGCCAEGKGCGDCCKDGTCAMGCCENGDCKSCTMKADGDAPAACCKDAAPKAGDGKGCCGK